ncbi:MAG TPA: ATP-binding cassette domain-containing protein [Chitinophagaceae bacterium]|jgi:molybdate transport system ATP-binding protein
MIHCSIYKTLQTAQGTINLDIFFEIEQGKLVTLFGPSGSGKTTILRILAGLTPPQKGRIIFNNEAWFDTKKHIDLPSQKRKVGFVFQEYALFPNMTVKENLMYALEKGQENTIVQELMHVMDLEQLQNRKPDTLSGGQKQRVALARALIRKPQLLLLDEPLSALDSEMRLKLQDHILKLHKEFNLTTILVSHDFSEIFKMSDTIMMLKDGKISSKGIPAEILFDQQRSGDFQLIGEVINIEKENFAYVISFSVGNNIIKINSSEEEAMQLNAGDKILISLKALNPLIKKIS